MKHIIYTLIMTVSMSINMIAQEQLNINTSKSNIKWSGEYTFYFGGHNGTINFTEGHFIKTNDLISGGQFIIDMASIKCDDIDNAEANEGLVNHLKDPDFFNVDMFSIAELMITKVEYHDQTHMRIEADLTIKNITLPINFQAEVDFETQEMIAKFKIDRRRWDVNYTSKMKDGAISDGIGFEVTLSL